MTESIEDVLAHYGVKGMKWGVIRGPYSAAGYQGTGMVRVNQTNLTKEQGAALARITNNLNSFAKGTAKDLDKINAKYSGKDLNDDKVYTEYRKDTRRLYTENMKKQLPQGLDVKILTDTKNLDYPGYVVVGNKAGLAMEMAHLKKEGFTHSAMKNALVLRLLETIGPDRLVTDVSFTVEETGALQQSETLEDVLAHYGIKGMKWGVRRKRGADGTVGGGDDELSEDAANALAARQKARKQGTQALSNKELQDLVSRIDLEKKYAKTFGESEKKEGKKFVRELLREESKRQVRSVVSAAATVAVAQALAKAAAKNGKPFVVEVSKKFG